MRSVSLRLLSSIRAPPLAKRKPPAPPGPSISPEDLTVTDHGSPRRVEAGHGSLFPAASEQQPLSLPARNSTVALGETVAAAQLQQPPTSPRSLGSKPEASAVDGASPRAKLDWQKSAPANQNSNIAASDPVSPTAGVEEPEFADDYNEDEEEDEGIYVALPILRAQMTNRASSTNVLQKGPSDQSSSAADSADRRSSLMVTTDNANSDELAELMARASKQNITRVVNLKSIELEHRTNRGWLNKKGGKLGTKGWDRRWFVFEHGVLKYFKDEKDKKSQGNIPLRDMQDIIFTPSTKTDVKHAFRFELKTHERIYYLSAESAQEMTEWLMLLGALIQTFKPSADDQTVGGGMACPDKAGWIKKQGTNFREGWNKRYMALKDGTLCYYTRYDDFVQDKPITSINTLLVSVRIGRGGSKAKNHQFQLVTQQRNYEFQAESKEEMMAWITAIQNSILWSLNQMQSEVADTRNIKETISPEKVRQKGNQLYLKTARQALESDLCSVLM